MNLRKKAKLVSSYVKVYGKPKIFGIGANKTGSTSLKIAVKDFGFTIGDQREAERLCTKWAYRDFGKIIKYCYSAQFFQDIPFSLPFSYVALDHAFKNSKFILTIRDDSEQWYNSITKFHGNKWGVNGRTPTMQDLKKADYYGIGNPWIFNRLMFNTPENDPYNKKILIDFYENHNQSVMEYFRHRPDDLIIINVAKNEDYNRLCNFLGVKSDEYKFPWRKKSTRIKKS
ncbi:sulfotransferase [Christiangramia echinicola]|uniref:Sulfotransferase family protein n=1 Tax=Christiangramia echinicola TaxID=279359 RepID=A0A1H1QNM6_9FLAO|nr:sulfotransferase [Christiangramia echinicola]SDS25082.1 hypothetical protein SAMN04488552_2579 [Christiangramia echinicola]